MRNLIILLTLFLVTACSSKVSGNGAMNVDSSALTPEQIQAAWKRAMTPSEEHVLLNEMAGEWNASVRFWMKPDMSPQTSTAESTNTTTLNGKFLIEDYRGSFDGQPFKGMGISGFDTVMQQFTHYWIDNMGTGAIISAGKYDPASKTITMRGSVTDPISGKKRQTESRTRIIDENNHVFEMYDISPEGTSFKTLEIAYKRK